MKVLLMKDLKTLGKRGEVKEVSDGYANNYLFKNGIAVIYNQQTKANYEAQVARLQQEEDNKKQQAILLCKELENITLTFYGTPNAHGYLTGTVSIKEIKKELETKHNIKLDKSVFNKNTLVNTFGLNHVDIEPYKGVKGVLNVLVKEKNKN